MVNRGRFCLFGGQREYSRRTLDLVHESLVVDMLGLVTLNWERLYRWQREPASFGQPDKDRLLQSGINVLNPAVDLPYADPVRATEQWLRDWNKFIDDHPRSLLRVDSASDLARAKQAKRTGIILGFQNADHFRTAADVSYFYRLGQRISQVTYNQTNLLGGGCFERYDCGLTPFGAEVVREMNRLGMAVDVSHSGEKTVCDTIEASSLPVLVTHANCHALNPHPRCKSDRAIRMLASKGGVFGITSVRRFVRAQDPTTVEHVLDHFDHAVKLVGVEHVGVGSDTDLEGRDKRGLPGRMDIDGLDNALRMFELTEGLVRRRYSDGNIRLMLGGNFERVLSQIWSVSQAPEVSVAAAAS